MKLHPFCFRAPCQNLKSTIMYNSNHLWITRSLVPLNKNIVLFLFVCAMFSNLCHGSQIFLNYSADGLID